MIKDESLKIYEELFFMKSSFLFVISIEDLYKLLFLRLRIDKETS